jgi:gliding motility-associated-like protein
LVKVLPLSAYYKESDVNAFSPNGDGKNDCFSPALQLAPEPLDKAFVECTDLFVYNRWGELVFDSVVKGNACWNGTKMNGDDLPEGVYFYRYRYNGEERAGAVHLRRL